MKKYLLLIFAMGLLFTACEDDLNTLPEDDDAALLTPPTNEAEALSLLAGVYANLAQPGSTGAFDSNITGIDGGTSTFSRTLWYMQELPTDEAVWSYENDAGVATLQRGTWTASNEFCLGAFARMSQTLFFANNFLRQTEGSTISGIEQMRAEARFIRALSNYYLLDLFGKAPFAVESDPLDPSFDPPEIAGAELFNYVESELLEIIPSLSDRSSTDYGRASKGAAYFLLAKLYLNAEVYTGTARYDDCVTQLQNVIGQGYQLTTSPSSVYTAYDLNFLADNHTSPEIVFPIVADGQSVQNFGATTIIIQGEVASNEPDPVGDLGVGGFGGALRLKRQASELLQTADAGDRNTLFTTERTIDNPSIIERDFGFTHKKFRNRTSNDEIGSSNNTNAFVDTDFPLFRFADVHLMYAECALRGAGNADLGTATDLVNQLRTRVNAPTVNQSDLTLEWVLNERLLELFWEGHRRQDLIRFGLFTGGTYNWEWKGNTFSGTSLSANRAKYPIPALSLSSNQNLTQNPGY